MAIGVVVDREPTLTDSGATEAGGGWAPLLFLTVLNIEGVSFLCVPGTSCVATIQCQW